MDAARARGLAYANHQQRRNRHGELVIEHVARVAAAVPPEAQTTAWLHDVLEASPITLEQLRHRGLSEIEAQAIDLLTRPDSESYEAHALRTAHAPELAGRLARMVKLADLDDHLARPWTCGDPPYAWARRRIVNGSTAMAS